LDESHTALTRAELTMIYHDLAPGVAPSIDCSLHQYRNQVFYTRKRVSKRYERCSCSCC